MPFLLGLILCCKEAKEPNGTNYREIQTKTENIFDQEDFEVFFERFNKDSAFQLSRIKFPLRNEVYDTDSGQFVYKTIERKAWKFFNLKKLPANYVQKLSKDKFKYVFNIQIIDTGVNVDYIFTMLKGKWFLLKIVDSST